MADKKDDKSIIQYCATALLPNIVTLKKTARNILKRSNIEDIHDLRVSSRRIRTVLNIFSEYLPNKKFKSWEKDIIDDIYESTEDNKIRSGLRRIRMRLKQKRKQKQENTKKITRLILDSTSIVEMNTWAEAALENSAGEMFFSSELYRLGYKHIQTRLDEFIFYEVFIFDPARVKELHQMRISAKQLRYALEMFSNLYENETNFALDIARQAQEYLGNIHDSDVWIDFLPNFMNKEMKRINDFYGYSSPYSRIKPGIEYLIKNRKRERTRLYKAFLKDWKKWKFKETWLNLRKVIFLTSLETHHLPPTEKPPEIPKEPPAELPPEVPGQE
jgi:CHAD domain-containing protein